MYDSSNNTVYDFEVSQGQWTEKETHDFVNEIVIIESNISVYVYYAMESNDWFPMHPASDEWWGVPSEYLEVAIAKDSTHVTIYKSDGTIDTANSGTYLPYFCQ